MRAKYPGAAPAMVIAGHRYKKRGAVEGAWGSGTAWREAAQGAWGLGAVWREAAGVPGPVCGLTSQSSPPPLVPAWAA